MNWPVKKEKPFIKLEAFVNENFDESCMEESADGGGFKHNDSVEADDRPSSDQWRLHFWGKSTHFIVK